MHFITLLLLFPIVRGAMVAVEEEEELGVVGIGSSQLRSCWSRALFLRSLELRASALGSLQVSKSNRLGDKNQKKKELDSNQSIINNCHG